MRVLSCLLVLFLLAPLAGAAEQAPPFPVLQVQPEPVVWQRWFDGTVEAVNKSTVSAQIAGRIEEINFDVDDEVPQGAILIRFRAREQQAELDRAKANLAEAEARAREAENEFRRIRDVYKRKLVSKSDMDRASATWKAAQARLKAARSAVARAEEKLEHTVVRAPYSGIVTERHVEVGESVTVGQPLMTGISLESLRVSVSVPQTYIHTVRAAGTATVTPPGEDAAPIASDKLTVFPFADVHSHSFTVRVQLPPGQKGLYPGMLVKVAFPTEPKQRILLPQGAVVRRSELTAVYVLDADGRVRLRQLRLGRHFGDRIEVAAGLQPGERVALDPIQAGIYLKTQR
ncbi:MAG TPA: efflux RND transporter periplasmic adaptor subunit [Gammaproteobacteria bacterium]|nr:efflux RND transporter periplasmic adaptor subunit [Gammaproteobacteria bacterium]